MVGKPQGEEHQNKGEENMGAIGTRQACHARFSSPWLGWTSGYATPLRAILKRPS